MKVFVRGGREKPLLSEGVGGGKKSTGRVMKMIARVGGAKGERNARKMGICSGGIGEGRT